MQTAQSNHLSNSARNDLVLGLNIEQAPASRAGVVSWDDASGAHDRFFVSLARLPGGTIEVRIASQTGHNKHALFELEDGGIVERGYLGSQCCLINMNRAEALVVLDRHLRAQSQPPR